MNVGVIGCGNICGIYLQNCPKFKVLKVAAVADLLPDRARKAAQEYNIPHAYTPEQLFNDSTIDIVLNLTVPKVHASIALTALDHGKHVYSEKPLGITRQEGKTVLDQAKASNLKLGGAPDTFLGGSFQTAREIIDSGTIGKPVSATAFMVSHGWESWHPNPLFYYEKGGGPTFDMGPYYITALVNLLGPVTRVGSMCSKAFEERVVTSQPLKGHRIPVEITTHDAAVLEFADGAIGTVIMSFDVWKSELPRIEIHGTEGSLSIPDPNGFGGTLRLSRRGNDWQDVPITRPFTENWRGVGVADLAASIVENREARASGELTYHVLDIMQTIQESSAKQQFRDVRSTVLRPQPLSGTSEDLLSANP